MPERLVKLCVKYEMPALALTDSSNLFGALEFSRLAVERGIQPIVGSSVSVRLDDTTKFESNMVLLAKDDTGLSNLMKIVSSSFSNRNDKGKPAVNFESIRSCGEGLIALTGGVDGVLFSSLLKERKVVDDLLEIFGDRLYVELQRHTPNPQYENSVIKYAYEKGIPLVATNNVLFESKDRSASHNILICIANGENLSNQRDETKVSEEQYFKSCTEMEALFSDIPEAIENTWRIAKRCSTFVKTSPILLPSFVRDENISEEDLLIQETKVGLQKRMSEQILRNLETESEIDRLKEIYEARLAHELNVICSMNYAGYFLIVSDFIKWSKDNNVPVGPGRGSGAGSLVAWVLDITDIDPIKFGLIFERFLNPDRISMPDFDIDFCQEKRDKVIEYVRRKYSDDHVAQIITFGKLQPRAALRDVGRVMQMPYGQVDKICAMVPNNPAKPLTLSEAVDVNKALREEMEKDRAVGRLVEISLQLEGLYRHVSTHAAGIVISRKPVSEVVPLYTDGNSSMSITQYDMKSCEYAGLIKFDFLGLKTLTLVDKVSQLIRRHDPSFDISKIALDDEQTYEFLSMGESVGVFQLESAAMKTALRKLQPDSIEDIIALISLNRPGPMENIPKYVACKHGKEKPDYLHPMLTEVLKETFGVIIYQEQVMQIARILSGYTLSEADLLRRAMGKKNREEMDKQRKGFVAGAISKGVQEEKAVEIFNMVEKFAGYGFNKSHAAAYGIISYQTAYLKSRYPVEFYVILLNMDINNTDKLRLFCYEVKLHGIEVMPPDINASGVLFEIQDGKIRYGLAAVKNAGVAVLESIIGERNKNGKFRCIWDFLDRISHKVLSKRIMESLVKSGAFRSIHDNCRQIYESLGFLLRYNASSSMQKTGNQIDLFAISGDKQVQEKMLQEVKDWSWKDFLRNEHEMLGFYLSGHPLDSCLIGNYGLTALKEIGDIVYNKKGSSVRIAVVIDSIRIRSSQRGKFAILDISDQNCTDEISIYDEKTIDDNADHLYSGNILIITASIKETEGGYRLIANKLSPLGDSSSGIEVPVCRIELLNRADVSDIKLLLAECPKGKTELRLIARLNSKKVEVQLSGKYSLSRDIINSLDSLSCVESVILEDA